MGFLLDQPKLTICLMLVALAGCFYISAQAEEDCEARGGVMVYSSPIAGGVPIGKCVAAPPGAP
jgi:hypothetical protein